MFSALSALMLASLLLVGAPGASAQGGISRSSRTTPTDLGELTLSDRVSTTEKINTQLGAASGRVSVVVRLSKIPAAQMSDQVAQGAAVTAEQDALIARVSQIDASARVLGRAKLLLNAVMFELDAASLDALAADIHVAAINPVVDFELDLGETVPYIGATPGVQGAVNGGAGVTVAVLDSGIDYTHVAFGGAGTQAAYQAVYGTSTGDPKNTTRDGLFPTAKVVEGYDFVGEVWPNGDLAPDADPIDCGGPWVSDFCDGGHGTHVADIIGGAQGVAPGVSLYAVKVCSAVSTSCSGVALIQGMEYAVDPNGDGKTDDHVDIVNMSLGSSYGNNYFDDLATAVQNADGVGVLTVASAGNSADRPYIVGTPSSAPAALSVAQTQVPSAVAFPLVVNSPASIAGPKPNTATLDWAPLGAGFSGDVAYVGRGCVGDAYLADPAGKVALIDRGTCNISEKVRLASDAGATAVLIGLIAAGDAVTFSNGGQCPVPADGSCKPAMVIIQSYASQIKGALAGNNTVNVSVSDAVSISLTGSMVGSSSRGPSMGDMFPHNLLGRQYGQLIKPEIGAPGASVSAMVGTGSGTEAFGGTSGAAPMVSGAAALLIAKSWSVTPHAPTHEIKARLMNTAETTIYTNPATQPGVLAPISRIGGGEVRIDRALATGAAAWELNGAGATLSFGQVDVSRTKLTLRRTVEVKNYTGKPITYGISSSFRYADDEANGAVTIKPSRSSITVPAYRSRYFEVTMIIDGSKLRSWTMNSGSRGGNPADLNTLEYDGYLYFTDKKNANNNLHMAWHVLPRISADARVTTAKTKASITPFTLKNKGVGIGGYQPFSLLGENLTTPDITGQGSQDPNITARYVGAASYRSGCDVDDPAIQFAVQTWQSVTHANYPLEIDVYLDIDRDGNYDAVAYTAENGGYAVSGQSLVYAGPIGGPYVPFFYTNHGTNSGSFVLTICGSQVGLSDADAGTVIDADFYTFDNFFTGDPVSSIPTQMAFLNERYVATDADVTSIIDLLAVNPNSNASYAMYDFGDTGSSETGLLLLNTRGGINEALLVYPR